jgi:hypothetical protein
MSAVASISYALIKIPFAFSGISIRIFILILKGGEEMRRAIFVILGLSGIIYLAGCGKKQEALEKMPEPLSMEQISTIGTDVKTVSQPAATPAAVVTQAAPVVVTDAKLEPLPPQGPYKPTAKEIQTALKNAGFYSGLVDGKIGPMSKKAIEEFQKANNLKADGKVGLKTWELLGKYLNTSMPVTATTETKR